MYSAKILADSLSPAAVRLTTMEVVLPRFLLAELNTHRTFCLAGDSVLEFDLPGRQSGAHRRVHKITLADFVDRWEHGGAPRRNNGDTGTNRQPIRDRLAVMAIRQLDETTGLVQTSSVINCCFSGDKPVYQVKAGQFAIAGSADHRILTPEGYSVIGELRRGDEIVVQRKGKRAQDLALDDFKKVGGRWRSIWQRKQRERLIGEYGGCQQCGSSVNLVIHHVIEVCVEPSLAFDETNIELLCQQCHKERHRKQHWQTGQYLYGDTVSVDRIGKCGIEATYDLAIAGQFPNFIANGVVVHNSRNSASSRAIPTERLIDQVVDRPFIPEFNARVRGMGVGEPLSPEDQLEARNLWLSHRDHAIDTASWMIHIDKSRVNRLLEPFLWHTALITATEWGNFFALRNHPAAQPEFGRIAAMMQEAYNASDPWSCPCDCWHIPLVGLTELGDSPDYDYWTKVSAGRCARVSYLTHDGRRDPVADIGLYNRLLADHHLSPLEHVARPFSATEWDIITEQQEELRGLYSQRSPQQVEAMCRALEYRGNLRGWKSSRTTVPDEHDFSLVR